MPLIIGEDKIKSIYVGDNKIAKAYKGNDLVYTAETKKPSRLPDGYTEIEYLEIANSAAKLPLTNKSIRSESVVDGIVGLSDTAIWDAYRSYILGCYISSSSYAAMKISQVYYNGEYFPNIVLYCGKSTNNVSNPYFPVPFKTDFKIDLSNSSSKTIQIGDNSAKAVWTNTSQSYFITLGNYNKDYNDYAGVGGRIYYLKASNSYWNNPSSVNYKYFNYELVPCITSDGKIGMYDLTNNESFLTENTMYFKAGPKI